jgi:hypothetical protein
MDVLVMGSHVLEKTGKVPPWKHVCFFNRSLLAAILAATGQLLTELAEDLVRVHGWDVDRCLPAYTAAIGCHELPGM